MNSLFLVNKEFVLINNFKLYIWIYTIKAKGVYFMNKKKILVVEDEFSINDTLKFALSRENFEVKGAYKKRHIFIY